MGASGGISLARNLYAEALFEGVASVYRLRMPINDRHVALVANESVTSDARLPLLKRKNHRKMPDQQHAWLLQIRVFHFAGKRESN